MAKDKTSGTVVQRVRAADADSAVARTDEPAAKQAKAVAVKPKIPKTMSKAKPAKRVNAAHRQIFVLWRPLFAIGRYFRDSWRELRQIRWTNRRATWTLTLAVLLFCAFFAIIVMLFDWIFNWVIQEVIL